MQIATSFFRCCVSQLKQANNKKLPPSTKTMYVLEKKTAASTVLFPLQILALFALPATEDENQVRRS